LLETAHHNAVSKSHDYFSTKLKELYQHTDTIYKQASIPSNLTRYTAHKSQNVRRRIAEGLILSAAVNIAYGEPYDRWSCWVSAPAL